MDTLRVGMSLQFKFTGKTVHGNGKNNQTALNIYYCGGQYHLRH